MRRRTAFFALVRVLPIVVLLGAGGVARADGGAQCKGAGGKLTAARTALAAAPDSLPARFALADALVEAACYHEAVHTLEDGAASHPRSAELQAKLRTTRSLISEQEYFEGKEQAELAAKASRNLLRCTRLGDIDACDEALELAPNDLEILLGKGAALLKAVRPAEAEAVYRRARQAAPGDARIATQLAAARAQRQSLLARCEERSDGAALQACQDALSKGADDEFRILSRMALLQQQRNQPAFALASYIAADAAQSGDRGVALGIVALTDTSSRRDAVALAARGSALLTLQRGREALDALRQAQSLAPSLPDLRARIAQAQKLAATESVIRPSPRAAGRETRVVQVAQARTYSNAAEPSRSH